MFLTSDEEYADKHATMRTQNDQDIEVLCFDIPRWSVNYNNGTGEWETPFKFIIYGNDLRPDPENVVKIFNRIYGTE